MLYACMYVCMYGCMYECMDVWMDVWMHIYIYMCVCAYVFMYVCMVGPQARLFFPRAERRDGRDEDGDEAGTWQNNRKLRLS